MSITLNDIENVTHEELDLTTKVMYLMVKQRADKDGWATISVRDFCKLTGMSDLGVRQAVKRLLSTGLVEKNADKEYPYSTNQYRIVNHD